ncbi:MAG: SRPBCC domain-containing protein [Gemmatimonadaceae bacterium]
MTQVSLVRRIAARPAIVFDALVTAEGIGSWWGPDDFPAISAEADAHVAGSFRVRFRTADGFEHECAGEFLEIERPERVVMSWRWTSGGVLDEQGKVSCLEIRLRPIETGTELTLVHSGLTGEGSARSHDGGWAGALEKLMRRFSASVDDCSSDRKS